MRLNSPLVSAQQQAKATGKSAKRAGGAAVKRKPPRRAEPVALLSEHFPVGESVITFAVFNPTAREVFVAGSFNGWEPAGTAMTKGADGIWRTELLLKPGAYEYRFVVDGVWQDDPMSQKFAANPFGGLNSVVVVKD